MRNAVSRCCCTCTPRKACAGGETSASASRIAIAERCIASSSHDRENHFCDRLDYLNHHDAMHRLYDIRRPHDQDSRLSKVQNR